MFMRLEIDESGSINTLLLRHNMRQPDADLSCLPFSAELQYFAR